MKGWKKFGVILSAAVIASSGALTSVHADELDDFRQLTDVSALSFLDEAEDTAYSLTRSSDLRSGNVHIGVVDKDTVAITGKTEAYHVCDIVDLYIYLERVSNGSTFASYKEYPYTAKNVSKLEKTFYVDVDSGYYYRLRGYHRTYKDGTKESLSTDTNGVFVGVKPSGG